MQIVSGHQAIAQTAAEPANIMLYGPPGLEKTTDAIKAATRDGVCRAMYAACEPGGLKAPMARGLPLPDTTDQLVTTYEDLVNVVVHAGNHRDRYDFVIVDTLTAWNTNIVKAHDAGTIEKGRNGYAAWEKVKAALINLRDGCRAMGLHVIYIAHDVPPSVDDKGVFWMGAPSFQPKSAIKAFVGGIDTILRVGYVKSGVDTKRVYFTGGAEWPKAIAPMPPPDLFAWYCKNRDGVGAAVVEADLKAYLRMRQPPYAGL